MYVSQFLTVWQACRKLLHLIKVKKKYKELLPVHRFRRCLVLESLWIFFHWVNIIFLKIKPQCIKNLQIMYRIRLKQNQYFSKLIFQVGNSHICIIRSNYTKNYTSYAGYAFINAITVGIITYFLVRQLNMNNTKPHKTTLTYRHTPPPSHFADGLVWIFRS